MPDGSMLVDELEFQAGMGQLSLGFYYEFVWPGGVPDQAWLDARKEWGSAVRDYLKKYAAEWRDSPFLVEQALRRGDIRSELMSGALAAWDAQRLKEPPPRRAVWLDYGPLLFAIEWAQRRAKTGALIWFQSRAVGNMLLDFGIPTLWEGTPKFEVTPLVALSQTVYHKGRNLQAWSEQLILQPPPNAVIFEQLLGRTHRQGQSATAVRAEIYQHTQALEQNLAVAAAKANYVQTTTGQQQKLLLARRESLGW